MKACILFLCLILPCLVFAQPDISAKVTTSGVTTTVTWPNKAAMDANDFVKKFFKVLHREYYIERMDEAYSETVEVKENKKNYTKTVTRMVYYFVKPAAGYYPEALLSFKTTTTTYNKQALKNPKIKVKPKASIELVSPCHLYTDYFDFALDKFDVEALAINIKAVSDNKKWSITASFSLKSLFLIAWLTKVKAVLKITGEPKVHSVLLFFKHRFEHVGRRMYLALNK